MFEYKSIEVDGDTTEKRKKLCINPYESEAVKKMFLLSSEGTSGKPWGVKKIAAYLNDNGIKHRNKKWTIQAVSKMLRNTAYIGDFVYRSKTGDNGSTVEIIIPIPAIIDKELFEKVAKGLEFRKLSNNESAKPFLSTSLLTGILCCKECGSNLTVVTGKSGRYKYYSCARKKRFSSNSCSQKYIRVETLEKIVIETFIDKVLNFEPIASSKEKILSVIKKRKKESSHSVNILSLKKSQVEQALEVMLEKVSRGELVALEVVNKYISDKQQQLQLLESQISELKSLESLPVRQFGKKQLTDF